MGKESIYSKTRNICRRNAIYILCSFAVFAFTKKAAGFGKGRHGFYAYYLTHIVVISIIEMHYGVSGI